MFYKQGLLVKFFFIKGLTAENMALSLFESHGWICVVTLCIKIPSPALQLRII